MSQKRARPDAAANDSAHAAAYHSIWQGPHELWLAAASVLARVGPRALEEDRADEHRDVVVDGPAGEQLADPPLGLLGHPRVDGRVGGAERSRCGPVD